MSAKFVGTGIGKGIVVLRLSPGVSEAERKRLLDDARVLAKANSTKSKVYRVNWKEYHRKKQMSLI